MHKDEGQKLDPMYWPGMGNSDDKVSFFAYWPRVDMSSSDYSKTLLDPSNEIPVRLTSRGQNGDPILTYRVSTVSDQNLKSYDLMAARPILNAYYDASGITSGQVSFDFIHLLSAVSVHVQWTDGTSGGSSSNSPKLFIYKAGLTGLTSSDLSTEKSQFRKQGLFNLRMGTWYCMDYEALNLLGDIPWLLNSNFSSSGLESSKHYALYSSSLNALNGWQSSLSSAFNGDGTGINDDKYLLIIPNSKQKKLLLELGYNMLDNSGNVIDTVDESKVIDLDIKPGYVYQILLTLSKKKITYNVNVVNWAMESSNPYSTSIN
jgi:hypothetical protein